MRIQDTPMTLVNLWDKACPNCYQALERCEQANGNALISWPDYCTLPIGAAFTYLVDNRGLSYQEAAMMAAELTACYSWQKHKNIYDVPNFNLLLLSHQKILGMKPSDVIPFEALLNLPEPCVYVRVTSLYNSINGFFAWLEYDMNKGTTELRIQWMEATMDRTATQVLHIHPGWTIQQCLDDTLGTKPGVSTIKENMQIMLALQIILYLVSENADIETEPPIESENTLIDVKAVGRNISEEEVLHAIAKNQDQSTGYQSLQVGGKYPPVANAGECVAITVDSAGITLVYNFLSPTEKEIAAMQEGQPFEIRFVTIADILYVLTKCGSLNWTDAPFNPNLSKNATLPEIMNDTDGYTLTLMMVDAATNTIESLRLIGLGNAFSKALRTEIETLKQKEFDAGMYQRTIKLNNMIRSTKDLVKMATHYWKIK